MEQKRTEKPLEFTPLSKDLYIVDEVTALSQAQQQRSQSSILNGVYIWVEASKTGHSFISTFDNGEHTLYSYGRYDDSHSLVTGDGVLFKYTGTNASNYMKENLYKFQAQVFLVTDVKISSIKRIFDNMLQSSDERPDNPKTPFRVKENGKVIDTYDLTGNNCTTHTVNSLKRAGSRIFNTDWMGVVSYTEDFMIPASLMRFLINKSRGLDMGVIEMTGRFELLLKNSPQQEPESKGVNGAQLIGTVGESIGYLGQSSGYSGGTFGGSF